VHDAVERRLATWGETLARHVEEAQVMEAEASKIDKTGWFKRTGWLVYFASRNLTHLAYQVRAPDKGEEKMKLAARLTERLVERCVAGLSTLGHQTRRWLRSAKHQEPDVRPMGRLQNSESQARCAGYMARFVCYLMRHVEAANQQALASVDSEEQSGEDTDSSRENDDALTTTANRTVDGLRGQMQPVDKMKDAKEMLEWSEQQRVLTVELYFLLDPEHDDKDEARLAKLLELLGSFIFERVRGDRPFGSGLLHFTAMLGIDRDRGILRTAKSYSNMLAAVVYCIRVLGAEILLPSAGRVGQSDTEAEAAQEHFLHMRREYLAEGSYSPMGECLSLLAYGKSVALATGNDGSVSWSTDKTIFYLHGKPICLRRFCRMAQDMIAEMETMLWEQLMWVDGSSERFTIALHKMVHDPSCKQRGHSFITNPKNGLGGGLRWMLEQAEQGSAGQKLLQRNDGVWNTSRVREYLRMVDWFRELLLGGVHVTQGQPGRGPEVTMIRH
jgi:hypothetical protein